MRSPWPSSLVPWKSAIVLIRLFVLDSHLLPACQSPTLVFWCPPNQGRVLLECPGSYLSDQQLWPIPRTLLFLCVTFLESEGILTQNRSDIIYPFGNQHNFTTRLSGARMTQKHWWSAETPQHFMSQVSWLPIDGQSNKAMTSW